MTTLRGAAALVLAIGATLALSGCGNAQQPSANPTSVQDDSTAIAYECGGHAVPASAVESPQGLEALSPAGREAVDTATYEGIEPLMLAPEADWVLAAERSDAIDLLRPTTATDETHELVSIEHIVDSPNLEPGWYVMSHSPCSLQVDLGELEGATVTLDPAHPLDAESTEIALLVTERACNSGKDAEGRVETVEIIETDTEVRFVVGIAPRNVAAFCPSNPATPHLLTLDAPLGDRDVIDAALVPARELR
ncbi:MAG: hypothetical protein ACQEW8_05410 [Actinomycetota bacterium]